MTDTDVPQSAERATLSTAHQAFFEGAFETCLAACDRIVVRDEPLRFELSLLRARVLLRLDRADKAIEALRAIAQARGVTVAQTAVAWVLSRGQDIVPLIGARRRDRLAEALGALELNLTKDDLAQIERAVPAGAAAGERYAAPMMAELDSERGRVDAV